MQDAGPRAIPAMSTQRTPKGRLVRLAEYTVAWEKGPDAEEKLASKLGYFGSRKLMHEGLAADGSPVCPRCGDLYPGEEHNCNKPSKREDKPRTRKPRGTAEDAQLLPPTADATDLFASAIERQKRALRDLPFFVERLSDERFVTEVVYSKDSGRYNVLHRRKDYEHLEEDADAAWTRLCEEHGQDPSVEEFREPLDGLVLEGAAWHPHDQVGELIGHYAISGGPLEPLLELLHPGLSEGDLETIVQKRIEVRQKVREFAALVRGNRPVAKPGRRRDPVSPKVQQALRYGDRSGKELPPSLRNLDTGDLKLPKTPEQNSD